jgi:hypothetical protein
MYEYPVNRFLSNFVLKFRKSNGLWFQVVAKQRKSSVPTEEQVQDIQALLEVSIHEL